MTDPVRFTLPRPPSTNNLYFNAPGKGRVKTAAYKRWIEQAGWEMRAQHTPLPRFPGDVALSVWVPSGIDLDNIKAIPDLLKTMGVIVDDRLVRELHVYRDAGAPSCTLEIAASLSAQNKSSLGFAPASSADTISDSDG